MSILRNLTTVAIFAAAPAAAFTNSVDQQLQFFATCTGRLSALMEHQWNYDTASVDVTTAQRAEMIDLVSAVMPSDAGRSVLLMRVDAKHAQAGLLRRAALNTDPQDAAWAKARAEALLQECTSVLIADMSQ